MKIRFEMNASETSKINEIVRTLDPEKETFTEDFLEERTSRCKFGSLTISKSWQEATRLEIELKPKFVEQTLDFVKEIADAIFGVAKKLMGMADKYTTIFSEWNQTKFESLAEEYFKDSEKPDGVFFIQDADDGIIPLVPTIDNMKELFASIKEAKDADLEYAFIKFEDDVAYEVSEDEGITAFARKFCQ